MYRYHDVVALTARMCNSAKKVLLGNRDHDLAGPINAGQYTPRWSETEVFNKAEDT
jgi:hypothetical protein